MALMAIGAAVLLKHQAALAKNDREALQRELAVTQANAKKAVEAMQQTVAIAQKVACDQKDRATYFQNRFMALAEEPREWFGRTTFNREWEEIKSKLKRVTLKHPPMYWLEVNEPFFVEKHRPCRFAEQIRAEAVRFGCTIAIDPYTPPEVVAADVAARIKHEVLQYWQERSILSL
jgi:hypothetical protein